MAVNPELSRSAKFADDCSLSVLLQPNQMTSKQVHFFEAARKNDLVSLEKALAHQVNVNTRNNLDRTALHWAAANGNGEAIEMLIRASANVNCPDKYGMTPVLLAAWYGHLGALEALTKSKITVLSCYNKQGMNAIHCAAVNDHVNILEFFHINKMTEKIDINKQELRGKTALMLASEKGFTETVEYLLTIGCDPSIADLSGKTALHMAAGGGFDDIIVSLIRQSKDEVNLADNEGVTATHLAAASGHADVLFQLMSADADINAATHKGMTPLMLSAFGGHVETASMLLQDHRCNVDLQNNEGNTAVHLASQNNSVRVLRHLIGRGCDVNITNKMGETALHVAAEKAHSQVVLLLLDNGSDLTLKDNSGKTAMQLASRSNCISIVDMIIKTERLQTVLRNSRMDSIRVEPLTRSERVCLQEEIMDRSHDTETFERIDEDGSRTNEDGETQDLREERDPQTRTMDTEEAVGAMGNNGCDEGGETGNTSEDNREDFENVGTKEEETCIQNSPNDYTRCTSSTTNGDDDVANRRTDNKTTEQSKKEFSENPRNDRLRDYDDDDDDVFTTAGDGGGRDYSPSSISMTMMTTTTRSCSGEYGSAMKTILWKLATKNLGPGEWKKLAASWKFTDDQIRAIEHQYTGKYSYREHSYRMMVIWLDCYLQLNPPPNGNPLRELYDGLVAIGRRKLAEEIRSKCNRNSESRKSCVLS